MYLKNILLLVVLTVLSSSVVATNIYDQLGQYLDETYSSHIEDFGVKIKLREQGFVADKCPSPFFEVERDLSLSKKLVAIHCGGVEQYVTAHLFGYVQAYVARRKYSRGELLSSNMFFKKRVPIASVKSSLPADVSWGSTQLIKPMVAGSILSTADFRKAKLFKRGQLVKAQYNLGSLYISGEFKILEDGYPGSLVRLLNQSSNEVVYGTVTEQKEIFIQ